MEFVGFTVIELVAFSFKNTKCCFYFLFPFYLYCFFFQILLFRLNVSLSCDFMSRRRVTFVFFLVVGFGVWFWLNWYDYLLKCVVLGNLLVAFRKLLQDILGELVNRLMKLASIGCWLIFKQVWAIELNSVPEHSNCFLWVKACVHSPCVFSFL